MCDQQSYRLQLRNFTVTPIACLSPTINYFVFNGLIWNIQKIFTGETYWTSDFLEQGLLTFLDNDNWTSTSWNFVSGKEHTVTFYEKNFTKANLM